MTALMLLLSAAGAAGPAALAAGIVAEHLAPPTGPNRTEPALDTCLGCDRPVPTGTTWCGWLCRGWDDDHTLDDRLYGGDE